MRWYRAAVYPRDFPRRPDGGLDDLVCERCRPRVARAWDHAAREVTVCYGYPAEAPQPGERCTRCGVDQEGEYPLDAGAFSFPPGRVRLDLRGVKP